MICVIQSATLEEMGNFLNILIRGFDDYMFMAFVMMFVFNIAVFMKYILSGVK